MSSSSSSVAEMVNEIHTWLHTTGADLKDQHSFVDAYCLMLREVGLPVDRFFCGAAVLHPLVAAKAWKWIDGKITDYNFTRAERAEAESKNEAPSENDPPMIQLINGARSVRYKATNTKLPDDLDWMKPDGYTDLFGLPSPRTGNGNLEGGFTWSTKAPGGFTDDHIAVFHGTLLSLTTVLRLQIMKFTSKSLLMTYLGQDAGARVHRGEIERGEGLTVRSVIWFSDIRGFTKLSGELNRVELVGLVNGVFEVTADVIREHKGQVLKFMGDGLMAIFSCGATSFQRSSFTAGEKRDIDERASSLCLHARRAACELQTRLAALRAQRQADGLRGAASVGVGLHYGDVSYGNVGAPDRLDFTVLGPHVNLASRTESLCSRLSAQVLCTEDFAKLDDHADAWMSRGEHDVKGVSDPVHIYELITPATAEVVEDKVGM